MSEARGRNGGVPRRKARVERAREDALDYTVAAAHVTYPALTALILMLIAAVAVVGITGRKHNAPLPVQFRLVEPSLSRLPVTIDRIESCSCWHGPRDEAQRKYKFRVTNHTDQILDIGGGEGSALRLIVAYPSQRRPRLTIPVASSSDVPMSLGSPPDVPIPIAHTTAAVMASRIHSANGFFGVPPNFTVWALPPAPNKLAEELRPGEATYPTVIDRPRLLPDEFYEGTRLGHGTWTFYIPLPHRFAQSLAYDGPEIILPRETYEQHVIIVGIAALSSARTGVRLIGFAPAPSDDQLRDPGEL